MGYTNYLIFNLEAEVYLWDHSYFPTPKLPMNL